MARLVLVRYLVIDGNHSIRLWPEFVDTANTLSSNSRILGKPVEANAARGSWLKCCIHGVVEFEVMENAGLVRGCIMTTGQIVHAFMSQDAEKYSIAWHVIHAYASKTNTEIDPEFVLYGCDLDLMSLA